MKLTLKDLDIDKLIEAIKLFERNNIYQNVIVNITNDKAKEFSEYLYSIAASSRVVVKSGGDKTMTADRILESIMSTNTINTGIKIYNYPAFAIHEHEKWNDGFVEGFVRIDSSHLLWTYIRMNKLKDILIKFGEYLYCYSYSELIQS